MPDKLPKKYPALAPCYFIERLGYLKVILQVFADTREINFDRNIIAT